MDRTDAEIIIASLHDPATFGAVFARHHLAVFRFVARRIGVEDAQDLAADTFVRAFEIRHRYDPSNVNCLPWLYGIAGNLVGDRLRRIRRSQRIYLVAASDVQAVEFGEEADARVVVDSFAGELNDALRHLSRRDRNTLLLYALEGLTYSEIANALDIPVGTVSSRIARARQQMSELIPDLEQKIRPNNRNHEDDPQ